MDALALDNSVARVRALTAIVQVGSRLLEVGELDERLKAIEGALGPRLERTAEKSRFGRGVA